MQTKNLQVTPNGIMPKINASQYDNNREVHFLLYDEATPFIPPSGSMIRVEGAKSDGNGFSYECSYTGNNVTVVIKEQMTVLAEDVECELRISKDLTDIGTINFILAVEKGALPSDIPISDTEIPAIIELAKDEQYNSEAWARGTRNGVPVSSDDPAYHNNAKWYAEHSSVASLDSLSDVTITNPQNGQGLVYDENNDEWINGTVSGGGGSTIKITTPESSLYGMPVSISDGTTTLTGTFSNSGAVAFAGVTMTGSLAIECDGYINTVSAPYFGNYEFIFTTFGFTLNVYAPVGAELSVTTTGETYTDIGAGSTPVAFILHQSSTTYTITATIDGISKSDSVTTPSTSGGSATKTIEFGTINVTLDEEFVGETITCVNGGTTISKTASSTSLVFYPPTTGTWTISGTVSGTTYSVDAEVTSLSTPVSVSLETLTTVSVTVYGAKEDTITFTDASGVQQMEVFASGQSSKSVTLTIQPSGTNITFTSSVSKNPDNLSANFSKTITVTSATTLVKVMPDNALYWYGYSSTAQSMVSNNGWSRTDYEFRQPVWNTRDITCTANNSSYICGIASSSTISTITKGYAIIQGITAANNAYGSLTTQPSKTLSGSSSTSSVNVDSSSVKKYELVANKTNNYLACFSIANRAMKIMALWYE